MDLADMDGPEHFLFTKRMTASRTHLYAHIVWNFWTPNWNPIPYYWWGPCEQLMVMPCNVYMIPGC